MEKLLESVLASIKSIKAWQLIAALVVLFGAGGATFAGYYRASASPSLEMPEDQQIIPVQYGDLINQVSTSGNLAFPNRNVLRFGTQGRVAKVLVEEGDRVEAGQALVEIDQPTAASLNLGVAQARIDLADAQREWDDLSDSNGKRMAEARSKVSEEELSLQSALRSLEDLTIEHSQQLAEARQAVAEAELGIETARDLLLDFPEEFRRDLAEAELLKRASQLALEQAQYDLSDFQAGYEQELAEAAQTRADAEVTLQAKVEALRGFSPDYAQELAQARDDQAKAQNALDEAQQALEDFEPDYQGELANALQAEVDARETFQAAQQALERYEFSNASRLLPVRERKTELEEQAAEAQADLDRLIERRSNGVGGLTGHILRLEQTLEILRPDLLEVSEQLLGWEQLEADVQVSEARLAKAQADLEVLDSGPDPARLAELKAALAVARSELTLANDDLKSLGTGPDGFQLLELEAAVDLARANLNLRIQELERLDGGTNEVRRQELFFAVEKSKAELALAEDALSDLTRQPNAELIEALEDWVETLIANHKLDLESSRETAGISRRIIEAVVAGADPRELELRGAKLALAGAELVLAHQEVEKLEAGVDPLELALRQEQVHVARASLAESERALRDLSGGADAPELLLARAKLDAAIGNLEEAIRLHGNAVLSSPIDGFVSALHVEAGEQVNANAPVVEVADSSVVEVDGVVDEIDVLLIPLGARADITLDALPGQTLEGAVTQIAPASVNQQGVVTYPIRVTVEVPEGVVLREGLTTVANLVLREQRNVLLIPQQSLYGTFDSPVVRLVNSEGEISETPVELGNSDDFWIEVRAGLREGDRLAMDSQAVTTTGSGFRSLRGITGGRGSGGPRRR